jgi:murein DD-endopeptidase MepM/ murein hydrolase activator NlpD
MCMFPVRISIAACGSLCCLTITSNAYIFESTATYLQRALIRWDVDTPGVTFSGTYTVYRDAASANRPYAWVLIPPGATITAFTSSANAGAYSWTYGTAQNTNCSTSTGLRAGVVNDFCYNLLFSVTPPFLWKVEINSTQYSPIRYKFSLGGVTNAQLETSSGTAIGSTEVLGTYQSRLPPTGSAITNIIVTYVGAITTGADAWYSFGWSYSYRYGDPTAVADGSQYALPFYGTYSVGQGNGGSYSHNVGSTSQYAIDFSLPSNTAVRAARAGYVSMIQEDQYMNYATACGTDLSGCGNVVGAQANYVYVIHTDGTMAIYIHLIQNGAAVSEGQYISVGDLVGYSGNTGNSTGPHLHFAVHKTLDLGNSFGSTSIQVTYSPGGYIPVQGTSYTNNAPVPVAAPLAPPVAAPRAPPVAPPVAAPRAPPAAPPVATPVAQPVAAPVAQPVAAPRAPPVAIPIASPVAPPLAQPVAAPRAPPVAAPVAAPIAAPKAAPVASPVASPRSPPVAAPLATPLASPRAAPVAAPRAAPQSVGAPAESPSSSAAPQSIPLAPSADPAPEASPLADAVPVQTTPAPAAGALQPTSVVSPVIKVSFSVTGSSLTQSETNAIISAVAGAVASHFGVPASDVRVTISGSYVATITFSTQSSADVVRNAGQTRVQAVQAPVLAAIQSVLSSTTAPVDGSGSASPVAPRVAVTNVEISGLATDAPTSANATVDPPGPPIAIIAGAAAGGLVVIVAIVVTIVVVKKKRANSPSTPRGVISSTPIETEIMSRAQIEAVANGGTTPRSAPAPPMHSPAPPPPPPPPIQAARPPPPPPVPGR